MDRLITFDIDSVVIDNTEEILIRELGLKYGCHNVVSRHENGYRTFHIDVNGPSNNQIHKDFAEIINSCHNEFVHTPWLGQVLYYVYQTTGRPITFLSARNHNTREKTEAWLSGWVGDFNLVLNPNEGKPTWCKNHLVLMHVDDRYKTIKELGTTTATLPVLYTREWNVGRDDKVFDYLRVKDLRGVIPWVNLLCGRDQFDWPAGVPHPAMSQKIELV